MFPASRRACFVMPQPCLETENLIKQKPQMKFVEAVDKLRTQIMEYDAILMILSNRMDVMKLASDTKMKVHGT